MNDAPKRRKPYIVRAHDTLFSTAKLICGKQSRAEDILAPLGKPSIAANGRSGFVKQHGLSGCSKRLGSPAAPFPYLAAWLAITLRFTAVKVAPTRSIARHTVFLSRKLNQQLFSFGLCKS
jgi:hypothetical protein